MHFKFFKTKRKIKIASCRQLFKQLLKYFEFVHTSLCMYSTLIFNNTVTHICVTSIGDLQLWEAEDVLWGQPTWPCISASRQGIARGSSAAPPGWRARLPGTKVAQASCRACSSATKPERPAWYRRGTSPRSFQRQTEEPAAQHGVRWLQQEEKVHLTSLSICVSSQ